MSDSSKEEKEVLVGAARRVRDFQAKIGAACFRCLPEPTSAVSEELLDAVSVLIELSSRLKELYSKSKAPHALRAELLVEELAEVLQGLAMGDEIELLDGLADLAYVVIGTATAFNLPLSAAFAEVHRSNMTKNRAAADHAGTKGKGTEYSPPNLQEILERHRGHVR